jgi:Zn-finger nucleic acid-binding protein
MDLSCARCGATLPPEAARVATTCRYCGATSAPAPVERVIERVVVGRPDLVIPAGPPQEQQLPCPRCADFLVEKRVGGAALASCKTCGGLWLDTATVERLKRAHDAEIEGVAIKMDRLLLLTADPVPQNMPLACPVCRARLKKVDLPDTAHVIDVCDAHGTWLDRARGDELKMLVTEFEAARAGEVTDGDLEDAGVGGGLWGRLFRRRKEDGAHGVGRAAAGARPHRSARLE